jgi:hypothetical protein
MIDSQDAEDDDDVEVEIGRLVVDLPEGDDPALGQELAQEVLRHLRRMIAEA